MRVTDLVINEKNILKRKHAFEKRLGAMLGFIKNAHSCRSKIIGHYFNDLSLQRCGICDNCIGEKELKISPEEFEKIRKEINIIIYAQPVKPTFLLQNLRNFNQKKIIKILHFLQEENLVTITEDGLIKRF